jgi:deoxyribodipyrimidine photolyase
MQMVFTKETIECMQREFLADKLIEIGAVDCDERNSLLNTPSETLQSWIIDRLEELNELYIKSNAKLVEENRKAKEIIKECMVQMAIHDCEYTEEYKKAENFVYKEIKE